MRTSLRATGSRFGIWAALALLLLSAAATAATPPARFTFVFPGLKSGDVLDGDRAEHCWNADPMLPNHLSRLHYLTQYAPAIMERIEKSAPAGADLKSWRY